MSRKSSTAGIRKNLQTSRRKRTRVALASGAAATSLLAVCAGRALATIYAYTPDNLTTDSWSLGTSWSSIPQSGSTTELTFVAQNGSTTFGGSITNLNTDDDSGSTNGAVGGVFSLNILDLGGIGSSTTGNPDSITIAAGGSNSLSFVSNGSTAPVVNLYANNGTGTSTLTYNVSAPITLGATTTFQGGGSATFNFSGVISGSGTGITMNGTNTLYLSGTNLYSGPTTVNAGILDLSTFTGSAASSAFTVNPKAQLTVDNSSGTYVASVTRTGSLTLDGGKLTVNGTSAGNTDDIFGALTLGAGAGTEQSGLTALTVSGGNNVILVSPSTTKNTVLTFSSLAYTAGGTVLFSTNGTGNIGASAVGTAGAINVFFTANPTVANGGLIGATFTSGTMTNTMGIIPNATSNSTSATDFATYFVTYDPTYGVRTITTYQSNSFALSGGNPANVSLSMQDTSGGSGTINSLLVNAGSFTETLSGTLIDNSGAILFNGNTGASVISGGTLQLGASGATGTAADAFVTTRQNVVNTIDSVISSSADATSSNNLTLSFHNTNGGVGAFVLGATNTYVGGTIINSTNPADIVFLGGTATGTAGTFTITPGTAGSFGAGNVSLNNVTVDLNHSNAFNAANNFTGTLTSQINQIGSGTATLSGNISGTIGVSQTNSAATLILSGSNTYSGGTTVSTGTVQLQANSGNTTGSVTTALSNSSNLTIGGTSTLQLRSNSSVSFNSSGTSVGTNGTLTIDVNNNGSGTGNTLTLGNNITWSTAGTEVLDVTGGNGYSLALGTLSQPSGTSFTISPTSAAVTIGSFTAGGVLTFTGTNTATLNGFALQGNNNVGITVNGPTVVLAASNAASGTRNAGNLAVILSAGTLDVNNNGAFINPVSPNQVTFNIGGGTLDNTSSGTVNVSSSGGGPVAVTLNSDFTFTGTQSLNLGTGAVSLGTNAGTTRTITTTANVLTLGGIANGTTVNSLTKAGAGTLAISGVSSYTGSTTISAGTLQISASGQLGSGNYGGNILNNGTLEYSSSANQSFTGIISGTGPLTKDTNASVLTLGASNTYTGITTIGDGTVITNVLGNNGETSSSLGAESGATARTIALGNAVNNVTYSGTLEYVGPATSTDHIINVANSSGGDTINSSGLGKLTLTGGIVGGHSITFNGTTTGEEDGVINGVAGVSLSGTNQTWIFTAVNAYTSNTNIGAGNTLQIAGSGSLNSGNYPGLIPDAGTLQYSSSANQTFSGIISSIGSLIKDTSASVLTLSSVSNSYSGSTTISAGTLSLTGTLGLGTGTAITSGATFTESSAGVIAGGSSLTVTAGTTSLAGANSYTGATQVSGGTLNITGSAANTSATIYSAGTISGSGVNSSGTGLIGGAVAVNGGNISLAAADATKQLTVNGLTLGTSGGTYGSGGGNATLTYAIGSGSPSAGVGNVEAIYVGTAGTSGGTLNVNSTAAYVSLTGTGNLVIGDTYDLLNFGSASPVTLSNFSLSPTSATVTTLPVGVDTATLEILNGDELALTFTGTPTPNVAFFYGGAPSTVWNDVSAAPTTNWSTDLAGTMDAGNTPGVNTDVILNASTQTGAVTTTLGTSTTINSLNVNGNGTNTIASDGSTLTIMAVGDSNTSTDAGPTYNGNPAGTGISIASGANAFTIQVPVVLGNSQTWTNASNSLFTVTGSGGTVTSSTTGTTTQTLTLASTGTGGITIGDTIADGNAGSGGKLALVVNNSSSSVPVILSASNTYSGGTTLSAGLLAINNASAIGTGAFTIAGGAIDNTTAGAITLSTNNTQNWNGNFTFNGTMPLNLGTGAVTLGASRIVTVNGTGALTVGGAISGTGFGITKAGTGTLVLNGSSSYTGGFTISGGTVSLGSNTALGATSNALTFGGSSNGTLLLNGKSVTVSALTGDSTATILNSNTTSSAGTLTVTTSGSNTYSGMLQNGSAGTLGLTFSGGSVGTLTLSGTGNTFSGGTTINSGTVLITGAGTIGGSGTTIQVNSGGALGLDGSSVTNNYGSGQTVTINGSGYSSTYGALTGFSTLTNNWQGNVIIGSANTRIGADNGFLEVSGVISGTAGAGGIGLVIRNATAALSTSGSTTQLSGQDTYSGNTNIIAGVLQLGGSSANPLPTSTALIFGNPSTNLITGFDLNGVNQQVAGISLTGVETGADVTITNTSSTAATLNVNTATGVPSTFAGVIAGGSKVALMKTGGDVLTLTGTNTYSGGTTVSAGTLLANSTDTVSGSTGSGLVTVTGGILGGGVTTTAGVVKGSISVNSGGTLTAGAGVASATVAAAPGILRANFNTTTLATGSNLDIKVNNVTGSVGTNWDEVLLSALNVSSGVNVNLYGLSSTTNMLGGVSNFNSATQFTITIADVSGVTPTTLTSELPDFTINTSNFTSNNTVAAGSSFSLLALADAGSGSYLELQYNPTPEPGTAMLVLGGVVPMLMGRRRRSRPKDWNAQA